MRVRTRAEPTKNEIRSLTIRAVLFSFLFYPALRSAYANALLLLKNNEPLPFMVRRAARKKQWQICSRHERFLTIQLYQFKILWRDMHNAIMALLVCCLSLGKWARSALTLSSESNGHAPIFKSIRPILKGG